ncbi:sulfite exporter TauE/SafE family protein [Sedimentitalea sp. JM2-8]|uniref:Probable membrane transporter protein n=1 Tax=Sedimentitalea xiamensis TaxID=3050037 RepID=A0ABT7FAG6_9RHOB|nr:sulfite exporter TauE/SafE family protein [Sedimentitalea xiamensis]MDK3072100.1 sulfite exporter TauE/SafE family protein [Sedimentitalea xiamensis]
MTPLFPFLTPAELVLALAIAAGAGMVKGLVGFAMPMITISGLSMFLAPELALAGLILPTVVTNGIQALRQGPKAALASIRRFGVFLGVGLVFLLASAQLVRLLSEGMLLLMIGLPVTVFCLMQIVGVRFSLSAPSKRIEALVGAIAGFIGGMSGIWGPPTVAYLTALNTPKAEQMRIQGVIYGLGAVALLGAHVQSGVLRAETLPFSLALVFPAVFGMWLGGLLHDRVDQAVFRRVTLIVLLLAGLALVRRGLVG